MALLKEEAVHQAATTAVPLLQDRQDTVPAAAEDTAEEVQEEATAAADQAVQVHQEDNEPSRL